MVLFAGVLVILIRPLKSDDSPSDIRDVGRFLKRHLDMRLFTKPLFIIAVFVTLFSSIGM